MTTGAEALSGGENSATENGGGAEQQQTTEQTTTTTEQAGGAEQKAPAWEVPADRADYVANKGWKGPTDVLDSYQNIEKIMGLPADARADAILIRPKADAKPEDVEAFVTKAVAGLVPEKPEGYGTLGIKLEAGETLPPDIEQSLSWMHGAGVPTPMAQKLVEQYQAAQVAGEEAFAAQSTKDMNDLTVEYGDKADDNFELGRRAFAAAKEQAGLTPESLAKIERAIGTKLMMKMMIAQGRNLVEAPGGGAPNNEGVKGNGFRVTPESAKAKIAEKQQDSAFMARYTSPNQAVRNVAIAEMEELQKIVAGTATA